MSAIATRLRSRATGRFPAAGKVSLVLCTIIFLAADLPLHSQPHASFVRNNRLQLVRHSPDVYRPWFGPIDSADAAKTLDSLLQRGFDPDVDLFGYDTSIVRFVAGELQVRREGRTEVVVRYPVYPEYLDTVGLLVHRDEEGWGVTLQHRPIIFSAAVIEKHRRMYREDADRNLDLNWTFRIRQSTTSGSRKFYARTSTIGNTIRSIAYDLREMYLPDAWKKRLPRLLVSVSPYPRNHYDRISFSNYDSTIIRFDGDEIVPLRPGVTQVIIDYPIGEESVMIEVDRKMVIRVLEPREVTLPDR